MDAVNQPKAKLDCKNIKDGYFDRAYRKDEMSLKTQTKTIDMHIYERDTEWLRWADIVIAECTCPSLGVGYELAYAAAHHIPVHIFYGKRKSNFSAMLNSNSYFTIPLRNGGRDLSSDEILKKG